ncbi:MAG: TetR/AcrR family transcriptional regulator, partial [Tsuneonella troitsensis]
MKTSRHSLLEIGRDIVCKQGFGGLSFGALALRAGIRKASVHHHFPAKSDFGAALIALETEALTRALAAAEGDTRRGYLAMREFLRERREQSGGGTALDLLTSLSADASTLEKESRT